MFLFSSSDPDVTETIRFARSRKHCETDLDMTYKKNLRNSGTGRIMIMNLVEVKRFSFSIPGMFQEGSGPCESEK